MGVFGSFMTCNSGHDDMNLVHLKYEFVLEFINQIPGKTCQFTFNLFKKLDYLHDKMTE